MTETPTAPRRYGDGDVLAATFLGGGAFVEWSTALDGLSAEDATRRVDGAGHSVADVTAHTLFWYEWLLGHLRGERPAWPEHASGGWPAVREEDWEDHRARLLAVLRELHDLALDPDLLERASFRGDTWGRSFLAFSLHGTYHLGQVVLIRRMLGAWPPPGGGDTW